MTDATRTPPWEGSVTPVGPPPESVPRLPNLLYAGVVTGTWAGILCLLVYLVGRLLGVPFELVPPGSTSTYLVPWFAALLVPLLTGVAAALLSALVLGRPQARRIVFWTGTALAVLSLWWPLLGQTSDVLWSSRLWLAVMHLVTWVLVVPQLARVVGDSEPTATEPRT